MLNQTAVENFLYTLDLSMPINDHFKNAIRDSFLYGWDLETLQRIFAGIKEAYKSKED